MIPANIAAALRRALPSIHIDELELGVPHNRVADWKAMDGDRPQCVLLRCIMYADADAPDGAPLTPARWPRQQGAWADRYVSFADILEPKQLDLSRYVADMLQAVRQRLKVAA